MRFVAGRGAVAERHREDVAGRGAEAEMLAGAPWQSDCREAEPWQSCWLGRCCRVAGRGAVAELLAGSAMARGCAVAEMLLPGRSIGKRGKKHARRKSSI